MGPVRFPENEDHAEMRIPRASILLPTLFVAWLIGCIAVHGPAILAYLAFHAVTTGVFATFMWRAEQAAKQGSNGAARPSDDESESPVHAGDKQAAVA